MAGEPAALSRAGEAVLLEPLVLKELQLPDFSLQARFQHFRMLTQKLVQHAWLELGLRE